MLDLALRRKKIARRAVSRRNRMLKVEGTGNSWRDSHGFDATGATSSGILLDRTIEEMETSVSNVSIRESLLKS